MLHIRLVFHDIYNNQQKATRCDVYDVAMATLSKLFTRQNRSWKDLVASQKNFAVVFRMENLISFISKSLASES